MGAWIETAKQVHFAILKYVASYVGAWIETSLHLRQTHGSTSHPMWVRGLKLQLTHLHCSIDESHPMWVRGLKQPSEVVVASSDSRILCGCVD